MADRRKFREDGLASCVEQAYVPLGDGGQLGERCLCARPIERMRYDERAIGEPMNIDHSVRHVVVVYVLADARNASKVVLYIRRGLAAWAQPKLDCHAAKPSSSLGNSPYTFIVVDVLSSLLFYCRDKRDCHGHS